LAILMACLFIGVPFFAFAWPGLRYWYTDYQLRAADGLTQATVISSAGGDVLQGGLTTKATRLIAYQYRVVGPDGHIHDFIQRDIASIDDVFTRLAVGTTVTIRYRTDNPAIARRVEALAPALGPMLLWWIGILPLFGMVLIAGFNTVCVQVCRRLRSSGERLRYEQEQAQLTAQGLVLVTDARVATRLHQMQKQHPLIASSIVILDNEVFVSPEYLHNPDDRKLLQHLLSGTSMLDISATLELSCLLELLPLTAEEQVRQRKSSEALLRSLPTFDVDTARKGRVKPKE
jgi:hypothetical protein